MIEFHLERSGVPTYLQLVQQVRQAIRLGVLRPGDQLPTVKEVVGSLAINPNTVLRAYRELDLEGLSRGAAASGTFVAERCPPLPPDELKALRSALQRWVARARAAGLDDEKIAALLRRHSAAAVRLEGRMSAPRSAPSGSASATARRGRCATARSRSPPAR